MLKILNLNKGVIIFYIILALVSIFCALRMNNLNIANNNSDIKEVYCA